MNNRTPSVHDVTISTEKINDLHRRLDTIVWPRRATGAAVPGFDTDRLRPLVDYWRDGFDWRAVEARLMELGQFVTQTADGRCMHGLHSRGAEHVPVLLIHGWPDSPLRFVHVLPLLVDAGHSVVAPSIPGFGFSDEPEGVMSLELAAEDFHAVMIELGYPRYAVHGGDWGSALATALARLHPESVVALHLTDVPFDLAFTIDVASASEAEVAYLKSIEQLSSGQLYLTANSAQPDVVALALTDSPVGLLGWLAHIFDQWSDGEISRDDLLAAASLMWFAGSIRSSLRLYSEPAANWDSSAWGEGADAGWDDGESESDSGWAPPKIEIPTAFALFPRDLGMAPRALADRHFAVERFTVMPKGGHFAALEQPELLADDMITFFNGRS